MSAAAPEECVRETSGGGWMGIRDAVVGLSLSYKSPSLSPSLRQPVFVSDTQAATRRQLRRRQRRRRQQRRPKQGESRAAGERPEEQRRRRRRRSWDQMSAGTRAPCNSRTPPATDCSAHANRSLSLVTRRILLRFSRCDSALSLVSSREPPPDSLSTLSPGPSRSLSRLSSSSRRSFRRHRLS